MSALDKKIDFVLLVTATNANPNGDPLNGNRPRDNYDGYGEISDVCIKRKIRNRLQDLGQNIFVQSNERSDDGCTSLKDRADQCEELVNLQKAKKDKKAKNDDAEKYAKIACERWFDVRAFGQVFAFKGDTTSVGVRGPVSIHQAVSVSPIDIMSMQITKSVNSASGDGKASDTMGTKHRVQFGLYKIKGSINCQLAEKTGFSYDDAQLIKKALVTLFDNDSSSARPDGSMEVCKVFWWEHNDKTPSVSTAKVHRSVNVKLKDGVVSPKSFQDYIVTIDDIGATPEVIDLV